MYIKILCTIFGPYTQQCRTDNTYHFQADLIWCICPAINNNIPKDLIVTDSFLLYLLYSK
jgi:hypothetical protein